MKLSFIANYIVLNRLAENAGSDASTVQSKLNTLGAELKQSGEDISDEEVQAALLNALIDSNGDLNSVDVGDVEAVKTEIIESRGYVLSEGGALHAVEAVGTVLGNTAFIHELAIALEKYLNIKVSETDLKARLDKVVSTIKSVTGLPAKAMEKAFEWIATKVGASAGNVKIAGLAGTLLATVILLAIAVYLFPSITSGVLLAFSISGMIGKGAEIFKLIKEIVAHLQGTVKEVVETIKKVDNKYAVYPKKGGKRLGTHKTKKGALAQLAAIEISKRK